MIHELNTLWVEGPLSNLERICLASMLKQGHEVILYTYGKVSNIPKGIIVRSADDILPYDDSFRHNTTGSISLLSDYFRLALFKKEMGVWIDCDCYLLRPLEMPAHGYILGYEVNTINSAVLHLPSNSQILNDMITACENPEKSPYWLDFRRATIKRLSHLVRGKKWHLSEMGWGIVGPVALSRLIPRYNMSDRVQPMKKFYPVDRQGSMKLFDAASFDHIINDPDITSIHIYEKKQKWEDPVPGSFIDWAGKQVEEYL